VSGTPRPEARIDQLTGLRTILAASRAERPIDLEPATRETLDEGGPGREAEEPQSSTCPFCEGHEDKTPPEVWADRPGGGEPDTPGWRVRAVPNLYPALAPADVEEGVVKEAHDAPVDPLRAWARAGEPDLFASAPAGDAHEVVINSPEHRVALADLPAEELRSAVAGWRARIAAHAESSSCVQLIVNEGGGAGASLEHSHAQLYALDFVPILIARERERFNAYAERTMGGELLADVAAEEVRRQERLVAIDDEAMVICPWASGSPFQLRIVPRKAEARFELDGEIGTDALGTALGALRKRFGEGLELNLWVRTAPRDAEVFHWHIDIAPRLAIKAGFEMATGVDINILPPERAASELREALG
jgi:UDPglucose--hexose-1-phosphate uridylyltransferase